MQSENEKEERYGIDFAEAFNFDEAYSSLWDEIGQMIEEGLNTPSTKRAMDHLKESGQDLKKSGKALVDDVVRDWNRAKNAVKQ